MSDWRDRLTAEERAEYEFHRKVEGALLAQLRAVRKTCQRFYNRARTRTRDVAHPPAARRRQARS